MKINHIEILSTKTLSLKLYQKVEFALNGLKWHLEKWPKGAHFVNYYFEIAVSQCFVHKLILGIV